MKMAPTNGKMRRPKLRPPVLSTRSRMNDGGDFEETLPAPGNEFGAARDCRADDEEESHHHERHQQ